MSLSTCAHTGACPVPCCSGAALSRELNDWGSEHDFGLSLGDDLPVHVFSKAVLMQRRVKSLAYAGAVREVCGAGMAVVPPAHPSDVSARGVQSVDAVLARAVGDSDPAPSNDSDPDDEVVVALEGVLDEGNTGKGRAVALLTVRVELPVLVMFGCGCVCESACARVRVCTGVRVRVRDGCARVSMCVCMCMNDDNVEVEGSFISVTSFIIAVEHLLAEWEWAQANVDSAIEVAVVQDLQSRADELQRLYASVITPGEDRCERM